MANDYDVLVIGGGGAGLAAACAASEAGAKVAVVEAGTKAGGSTALSDGVVYAAGSSVQRAAGINDSPGDMFEYYMTLNQHKVHPSIVRKLCELSAPAVDWLMSLGVQFLPEELYASGVESVPRGHKSTTQGAGIAAALEVEARRRGVDIACNTRVKKLVTRDSAVVGALLDGQEIRAGATVITTGGFGHNRLLLNKYYPEAAVHGDWTWAISAPTCVGDGLLMGQAAGADTDGFNRGLLLPTPGFYKDLDIIIPAWLVIVNREGRRFIRENTEYAVMSGCVNAQLGATAYAIFDEESRMNGKPDPIFAAEYKSGWLQFNWGVERLSEQIKKGKVLKANTVQELAQLAGIEPDTLASTVARYNRDLEQGGDTLFFKRKEDMVPIAKPPFYAAELRTAVVCLTSAGLRIDADAQVLQSSDVPIAGLYAAGEVTGSVLGERYVGGGNAVCNAVVYGRVAGTNAARFSASMASG